MKTNEVKTLLEDKKINVKILLSSLWVALMFIYLYVDLFGFFQPGSIESILEGKVWVFDITQTWVMSALVLMTIPTLMVFFSLVLPPKLNRIMNIIIASLYIIIAVGNVIGETWIYLYFGSFVEIILLSLVIRYSVKWPRQEN